MGYKLDRILIHNHEIDSMVYRIAGEISRDHSDGIPVIIGLLKGAVPFCIKLNDYLIEMGRVPELKFMRASSYGSGTVSSGEVSVEEDVSGIGGQDILLVDELIDTGRTPTAVKKYLFDSGAKSIMTCFLLSKPDGRIVDVDIDYLGMEIPDVFVVGFGMDHDNCHRYKKDIWTMKEM